MSRAHSVHVLFHQGNHQEPLGAFTVKHELLSWCKRNTGRWMYMTFRDGLPGEGQGEYIEVPE